MYYSNPESVPQILDFTLTHGINYSKPRDFTSNPGILHQTRGYYSNLGILKFGDGDGPNLCRVKK